MYKTLLIFTFVMFAAFCIKKESEQIHNLITDKVVINHIEYSDKNSDNKNKFLLEIDNKKSVSIYFVTHPLDSILVPPKVIKEYDNEILLNTSIPEMWEYKVTEVRPYTKDTLYTIGNYFREPDTNIFKFTLCYYTNFSLDSSKECQELTVVI